MRNQIDKDRSSEELMTRIGAGDRYAFEILVRRHQRSVLNFIYGFVGDRSEAEDLAQEVFFRVWQSAATYKPTAKFTAWLYRIAANLCINKHKSDRIKKLLMVPFARQEEKDSVNESTIEHVEKAPSPEELLLVAERKRRILNALQKLPDNQRMALILKTYDNLSYQEIAGIMGRSVAAVDSLLIRAKKNIFKKLSSQEKKPQVFRH
jgi:RNA polymerase sigma-70 factor (ECF subfamily)